MVVGQISIGLAFVAAIIAAVAYGLYYRKQDAAKLNLANQSFMVLFVSILFAAALLLSQILTHNFQLNYVYSYSARNLSTFYLISTFWAGQEGTFLMWLLFSLIYGLILIRTQAKKNPLVMVFLLLVNIFILLILLKKSPFSMIWDVHKDAPVGFMPADGAGLNPLLQNPWMVIHPPTLFVGYSSTVVAFAFAMSAMARRDFQNWVKDARPWVIFTVLLLGTGIMLGGYWAYTTLGWGGYWGWDPVENSSLVPWLLSVALLHGIIIQNKQKGLKRTNLFLAALSFLAMLWGSFLTRSGVLTDFSVHSFGESGLNMYLILFVSFFTGLFVYFYFKSGTEIKSIRFTEGIFSRETFILIGMLTVLFSAIFTFIGTSSPIFTGLFGKPSNVSTNFYNTIHIPIVIFMALSAAIAPVLAWKVSEFRNLPALIRSAIFSLFMTILAFVFGLNQPVSVILFYLSVFVIAINSYVVYKMVRNNSRNIGGFLSHVGIGLMLIGILTSSIYDVSEKISLPQGQFQATNLGYDLKFVGFKEMPDGKDRVELQVKSGDRVFPAEAQFYFSDYTKSYMVSPYVKLELLRDVYISPISYSPAEQGNLHEVVLHKGETKEVHHMNITFNNFEMGGEHADPNAAMVVKANLTVGLNNGSDQETHQLKPEYILSNGKFLAPDVQVPNQNVVLRIGAINASEGAVKLQLVSNEQDEDAPGPDMLGVEISKKPLIIVLWFGTLVAIAGVLMSLIYRSRQKV